LRTRVVGFDGGRGSSPSIPQHRYALAEDLMQPVVLLKVAAPHEDADHGSCPLPDVLAGIERRNQLNFAGTD
jgi:hypothetical protein